MAAANDQTQAAKQTLQARQKRFQLTELEHQHDKLRIKNRELRLKDQQLRDKIREKGRFDGMTDLWELSEKSKRAIRQNEEATEKLQLQIGRLRSELDTKAEQSRILTGE
jgi:hypothetical protein